MRELPASDDIVSECDLLAVDGGQGVKPLLLHQSNLKHKIWINQSNAIKNADEIVIMKSMKTEILKHKQLNIKNVKIIYNLFFFSRKKWKSAQ